MILFKKIDLLIQLLLIAGFTAWSIYCSFTNGDKGEIFVYACFTVGAWQIMSLLLHAALNGRFYPAGSRKAYAYSALITGLVGIPLAMTNELIIFYLMALCVIGPILAVWYTRICYLEIVSLEKKSLIHLKR